MIDSFVILAPILLLGVVALLGFVGCEFAGTLSEPQNLLATAGNARVALSWDPVSSASAYKVHRGTTSGGPYPDVIGTTTAAPSYTDSPLTNGTTYYYVVSAVGAGFDESDYSNEASATPQSTIAEVSGQRAKGQADDVVSASVAFPNNVTANNLLVAAGTVWRDLGGTTIAISDTRGTSYTVRTFVSTTNT